MNRVTKYVLVGVMGISMTVTSALPVLAESGEREGFFGRVKAKFEQKKIKVERKVSAVCEAINKRIDARINNYNNRKDLHIAKNQRNVARWRELANRLEAKGYDVSKLRTDLTTL